MIGVTLFLFGVLIGATCMWWVQSAAHRHAQATHAHEVLYAPIRRSVLSQLHARGTLNVHQLARVVDAPRPLLNQYLDRMVLERAISRHDHGDGGVFYTLMLR